MTAKKYWILGIVSLLFLVAVGVAGKASGTAETKPQHKFTLESKDILAHLQGVYVGVGSIDPEAQKYVPTEEVLKTDVELRLRQFGVNVLSKEEWIQTPGMPNLDVLVHLGINEEFGIAAVGIHVRLNELVSLGRHPTTWIAASTWHKGCTMLFGLNNPNTIREEVKDLVDMFINDYLAANPKKPKDEQEE